jgi:tRNA G18 (ribose-2'-O)-methylase SpoU
VKVTPLCDADDPRLAPYRDLRDPARLRGRGLFVAESRHVVRRLLAARRFRVRSVLATPTAWAALPAPPSGLPEGALALAAEPALLARVAGHAVHQGCLALAERGPGEDAEALWRAAAGRRAPLLVLEGLADPQNVGGVFRNARAFGAAGVLLGGGGADPLHRKAIRVSTGATLELPFAACPRWPEELGALREAGFGVWALCADEGGDLRRLAPPARVALLLGGEAHGLTREARSRAERRVRIAVAPGADSLNVATASGIALHHVTAEAWPCAS